MNIMQFWHSDTVPAEVQELISTWVTLNPEHTHQLFSSDSAKQFIHAHFGEDLALAYDQITLPAMRCDVFRVAYLVVNGGLYVDAGFTCIEPIKAWGIDEHRMTLMRKWHGGVCNGLICAPARHPWLLELWQRIESVLLNRQDGDVWSLTGPLLFIQIEEKEQQLADFDPRYCIPGHGNQARSIEVLDQVGSASLFTPCNALKHRSRAHWSKLQKVVPLFETREFMQKSQISEPQIDKALHIYLAHSQSSVDRVKERFDAIASEQDDYVTATLNESLVSDNSDSNNVATKIDELINTINQSSASVAAVLLDLTACMSEPHYNKAIATENLNAASTLCEHFRSSTVFYGVNDQASIIESHLTQVGKVGGEARQATINSLKASPALDFNLLDEGLRHYFYRSTLSPFGPTNMPATVTVSTISAEELDDIQKHFAEPNFNMVEKHPHLEALFEINAATDIAA